MKKVFLLAVLFFLFPITTLGIETSAESAILMDTDTHRILYAKNIHEVRSIASISKIMTALLAVESGRLDDMVTVGEEIDAAYGSAIYLQKGEQIRLRDLVYGLMLRSGNDASYAIMNYLGKEKFIDKMNEKAKELGMKDTTFHNPNGLDEKEGNYSSAYDMALLTSYAMKNPDYREIVSTKTYQVKTNKNTYYWINKHKLLFSYEDATGGKTGFTKKAKRTLVTTASRGNLNLVVVTLNDGNDFQDHISLLEYGFSNYQSYEILKRGSLELYDKVYYGNYLLSLPHSFSYPIQEGEEVSLKFELSEIPKEGKVGTAKVYLDEELIYEEEILSTKIQKQAKNILSWFQQLW